MKRSDFMLGGLEFDKLIASQIMETNVCSVTEDSTWRDLSRILTDNNINSLTVVKENQSLVGLITEYDILRSLAEGKDVNTLTAKDILTEDYQTVTENKPAMDVLNLFDEKRVFKVFVIDNGILKGVIVKQDIILAYLNATEETPKGF